MEEVAGCFGRLSSAGFALIAILEFLAVLFPQTPTLSIPLEVLLHALYDVNRGTRNPLLTLSKGRGRRPIQLDDALFRAMVAAVMDKRLQAVDTVVRPPRVTSNGVWANWAIDDGGQLSTSKLRIGATK